MVERFAGSDPTWASVNANAETAPAARRGRNFFFCSFVPKSLSGCGTPIDWCAERSVTRLPSRLVISFMASPYSRCVKPRPPYSVGIFIPKAPIAASPWMTDGGILPSRSIASGSTFSARKRSSLSMNARNSGRSGGAAGNGWTRSRRKLPRKICFRKDGAFHSASRASSATRRASSALTGLGLASAMGRHYNRRERPDGGVYSSVR